MTFPRPAVPELTTGFRPAPEVWQWARATFVDASAPLLNPDHGHLLGADVGVVWASRAVQRRGRVVVGSAELPRPRGALWAKDRQLWQLEQWFGAVPEFLVTLAAPYAASVDEVGFAALVEHELYHCAQAQDESGPRFRSDGRPVWTIRGHDVEEFVGIVERYGAGAGAGETLALVRAAALPPTIGRAELAAVCGTCLRAA